MSDKPKKKKVAGKGPKFTATFDGTHVVIGFEGFNLPLMERAGEELPDDLSDNRVVDILNQGTSEVPAERLKKKAYATDGFETARDKAAQFVRDNMKIVDGVQRGKLIIYGFSMGADTAVELAKDLKGDFVVDLLITVDTATGWDFGVDRQIPNNVVKNVNFWTRDGTHKYGHKGAPNTAESKGATTVLNIPMHKSNHAQIYLKSKPQAIELIKKELKDRKFSSKHRPFELRFDGKTLKVIALNDQSEIASYPAMSGLPAGHKHVKDLIAAGREDLKVGTDYTKPEYQEVHDAGPIPEDDYKLPLTAKMAYQKSGGAWGIGGWRLERGLWNDIVQKYWDGRGGFYLHEDGKGPGTAGCIGVSKQADVKALRERFIKAYAHGQEEVEIHVSYER